MGENIQEVILSNKSYPLHYVCNFFWGGGGTGGLNYTSKVPFSKYESKHI